jgi:hypothetical protein
MTDDKELFSEAKRLYDNANGIEKEQFLEATEGDIDPMMSGLIHRMASSVDEEEFIDFMVNGDMPPMELSDAEMEGIQGAAAQRRARKNSGEDRAAGFGDFFNNEGDITFYNSS